MVCVYFSKGQRAGYKLNIHIHVTTSATVFEGYSPLSGPGTARYLIRVQPVFRELSLICISVSASSATSSLSMSLPLSPFRCVYHYELG